MIPNVIRGECFEDQSRFDDTDAIHESSADFHATKRIHMPVHVENNPTIPPKNKPKKTKNPTHTFNHTSEENSN